MRKESAILENMVGKFSETGSNCREVEVNIFRNSCDYVEDCENPGKIIYFIVIEISFKQ